MRALLLAALLGAPLASACMAPWNSPGPGAFTLHPWDGGAPIVVPVEGRNLGCMEGLSNPYALRDGKFLWAEYVEIGDGGRWREIHVLDVATGQKSVVHVPSGDAQQFTLANGTLAYTVIDHASSPPTATLVLHDVATGKVEPIPVPGGGLLGFAGDDRYVAYSRRENFPLGPDRISVLDLVTREWLLRDASAVDLVGEEYAGPVAVGDGWLILGYDRRVSLHSIEQGGLRNATDGASSIPAMSGGRMVIHDGALYLTAGYDAFPGGAKGARYPLPDGPLEPMATPEGYVGVVPGYWVKARYSAPELNAMGSFWWVEEHAGALLGAGAVVALVAGAVVWRTKRV